MKTTPRIYGLGISWDTCNVCSDDLTQQWVSYNFHVTLFAWLIRFNLEFNHKPFLAK